MRGLSILIGLVLGCGGAAAPSAPSSTPAAPTEVRADADATSAGDVTLVSGVSVGRVHFEMSESELRAALGEPDAVEERGPGVIGLSYYDRGMFVIVSGGAISMIHVFREMDDGDDRWSAFPLRTADEITWESRYQDVVAAHGPPSREGDDRMAEPPERWAAYDDLNLIFSFRADDDTLLSVAASPP
jgi:hypothetical protein